MGTPRRVMRMVSPLETFCRSSFRWVLASKAPTVFMQLVYQLVCYEIKRTFPSSKRLILLPKLRPPQPRRAADKDIRMVLALFVLHTKRIAVVSGEAAGSERPVRVFAGKAEDDQSRRWLRGISAQPR